MIKTGITGGTGDGKPVVTSLLALSGIPVYIVDEESKWLTDNSPIIHKKPTALFGPEIYANKGLNEKLLTPHIFNNPGQLQQISQITHPEINHHFLAWIKRRTPPLYAIESAILFESNFYKMVDISLMIYALREPHIEETLGRDSALREEIKRRISSQTSDGEKKDRSNYIIYNDGRQALIPRVDKLLRRLQSQ